MMASVNHIMRRRPSQLDDIYSLLCVAYYFLVGKLPWVDYINRINKRNSYNYFRKNLYEEIRIKKQELFNKKLIETNQTLAPLFKLIIN